MLRAHIVTLPKLTNIIPSIIQRDQVGFVKRRQTSDATRGIVNVIHHVERTQTPSLLLSINEEKAFDRVHWTYMEMALSKFGFKYSILKAILALYSCPSAQVYSAGFLSTPFSISNGTRQGCPLSPTIFNLMIEPLAEAIRTHPLIPGFQFGSSMLTINLFADDVILFLTNPLTSLK